MSEFLQQMASLSSAEDFFKALDVPYDEHVVRVNRLHILKRLHDYLGRETLTGLSDAALKALYQDKLAQAHADFVSSDAVTERVFKVFQQVKGQAFIGLDAIEPLQKAE
ncbi:nitrogenase-stabilizing/protective protein NifW [Insolitispirillum peregrinum]|uniref:nitrogenase-stabilizing/protective protein NifW n=1 Tax=Insolitispirillum peregrinum TaxID=80876 RepID=UPI003610A4C0